MDPRVPPPGFSAGVGGRGGGGGRGCGGEKRGALVTCGRPRSHARPASGWVCWTKAREKAEGGNTVVVVGLVLQALWEL